jgi:two-component system response regulator RegA
MMPDLMASRRVLLIDDDEDFCTLIADGLRGRGHDVPFATTATDGLAKAEQIQPEVVLVDIFLPDQNGFSLARDLRKTLPNALIMGVTAFPRPPTPEQLQCGIACMFLKPCDYRDIARLIEGWHPTP